MYVALFLSYFFNKTEIKMLIYCNMNIILQ